MNNSQPISTDTSTEQISSFPTLKIEASQPPMKKYTQKKIPVATKVVSAISVCALLISAGAQRAQAASQAWTNAPVDNQWTNVNNWVGKGVPGVTNPAAGGLSADVA